MLHLTTENELAFEFRNVHPEAKLNIQLQRTLRVPDDGRQYPLPAGLGCFPLRHVEDFQARVPQRWMGRGGVIAPMYQSEAVWLMFNTRSIDNRASNYPFAIKIATGKINAVTGGGWCTNLLRDPQDYVVTPKQKWLDGYSVEKDNVRQFVAMPLGLGYSAEEQIEGNAEWGGIQIQVFPMKGDIYEQRFPPIADKVKVRKDLGFTLQRSRTSSVKWFDTSTEMGIAPGGKINQQIFDDDFSLTDWDQEQTSRCFIHLCNSNQWQSLTSELPTKKPIGPEEYSQVGIPWFDYYKEAAPSAEGSDKLAGLDSVVDHARKLGDADNAKDVSHLPKKIVDLSSKPVSDKAW